MSVLGALSVSAPALANGRYPIANQLVVSPSDPTHLALRTTFGLVLSVDGGQSFSWVCEKAAGFVNNEDPPIEVTGDDSIFVASSQAMSISHDGGCAWAPVLEELSIVDADVDASNPKRAVALASLYIDGGTRSGLEETLDNGKTWHPLGTDFDGLPATLAVAPSAPQRIYASGTSTDLTPMISVSDDNGVTWKSYPLALEQITVPFIAAVDPLRPDTLYVRAPTALGKDVLVVSRDAGKTFSAIFKAQGGLYGFALSPDGSQVAVGGPSDPLSVANTKDYAFEAMSDVAPLCLKWADTGLYACADEAKSKFSLGLSSDAGKTFQALFQKRELTLKACPAELDTGKYCPQAWIGQQLVLGIDAGAPTAGAPSSGGESSVAGADDAGAGAPSASAGAGLGSGGKATTAAASDGAGCSLSVAHAGRGLLAAAAFGFGLWATRRRRRITS